MEPSQNDYISNMKEKKFNQKMHNDNNIHNELFKGMNGHDPLIKQKYTPDNGNITTGISSDDAFIKINYKLEMERIEKLENERTK